MRWPFRRRAPEHSVDLQVFAIPATEGGETNPNHEFPFGSEPREPQPAVLGVKATVRFPGYKDTVYARTIARDGSTIEEWKVGAHEFQTQWGLTLSEEQLTAMGVTIQKPGGKSRGGKNLRDD